MKVSPKWLPPFVLLLSVRACLAAGEVADFLPPETKVVLGLRMSTIASALQQNLGPELLAQVKFGGFDPLKDLDEVIVMTNGATENPPALALLLGRFDLEKMARGAKRYAGVPLVNAPAQAQGVMALLDSTTALAGEPALVRAAIDRRQNGVKGTLAWTGQIEAMRAKYVVWGIGEAVQSLEQFQFGADFQDGLNLTAELRAASAADLEKVTSALQMLKTMAKANQRPGSAAKFEMKTEGATLRLSLRVPTDELKKAFQSQRGSLEAALKSRLPMWNKQPDTDTKVVKNDEGDTVVVTLPGLRR